MNRQAVASAFGHVGGRRTIHRTEVTTTGRKKSTSWPIPTELAVEFRASGRNAQATRPAVERAPLSRMQRIESQTREAMKSSAQSARAERKVIQPTIGQSMAWLAGG